MKPSVLNKLTCPVCSASGSPMNSLRAVTAKKNGGSPALFCRNCRSHFPAIHSIINLAPDSPEPVIFSTQWAMEFAPLVAVYDNIWRPILTSIISDLGWEMKTSKQLMNVSSGMDILDLACGTGNFTELFSDPAEPVDIIGADLSMPMLEHAGRNIQARGIHNVTLIRADAANWPFAPESFDRIHCAGALHLLPDVQNVFHSIYRSLKKGGCFVGATYCRGGDYATQILQTMVSSAHWIHWFDQQELRNLSSRAGFAEWEERTHKQGIVFKVQKA